MIEETNPRVGVFICDCGDKIAGVLDTGRLCRRAIDLPEVVHTSHEDYPCSRDGQERIRQAVAEHDLERLLVAGCTPRLVEKLFRQATELAGLEAGHLDVVDIREQCAYIYGEDPEVALGEAIGIIDVGVARLVTTSATPPRCGGVVESAMIIGSGLGGLTLALGLAESGTRVTLIEETEKFGGDALDLLDDTRQQIAESSQAVLDHPLIDTLINAQITEVSGHPGDYEVHVEQGDHSITRSCGAMVIANIAWRKTLGTGQWFDRERVKTQIEFEAELDPAAEVNDQLALNHIVMIFCAEEIQRQHCSRVCCNIGIRQAIRAKELNPEAKITVLFRDLYLGGVGRTAENEFMEAREAGVTFFRYRRDHPPVIRDQTVEVFDTLTGEPISLDFDRVVLTMPFIPHENTHRLAAILGLPQDEGGFLAEPRRRLRPGRYADTGVFVLGSAQQPADTAEALFQAYLTSSRVVRFLDRDEITVESPVAKIDPLLCTGCGNCAQVCPTLAIRMEKRNGILSISEVDELRCIGCGNCAVACPVRSITLPGLDNAEIPAQISAALQSRAFAEHITRQESPKIVVLACEWSAYAAADMVGKGHKARGDQSLTYPPNVRIIRMNCSARFDPQHVLWAFINGADGVFLGACPSGECHYGRGNLYALERVEALKNGLEGHGVDPKRLRLEFFSVDDDKKFVKTIVEFADELVKKSDSLVGKWS